MGHTKKGSQGFTLIEVLVAAAIAGIVLSAIYAIFISQSKTYSAQDQLVALQQSLRHSMQFMERDLRQAGYNPGGLTVAIAEADGIDNDCDGTIDEADNTATLLVNESESIGVLQAQGSSVAFSHDENGDGKACGGKESISYVLNGTTLKRNGKPLSENIDVLNFVYLAADGGLATSIEEIRSVQIAIVGRTNHKDPSYNNTKSYANLQGSEILPSQNDSYRRRLLTSQVHIRNLND